MKERTYGDRDVEARLKADLPHWYLKDGFICRTYRTHGWKGTLMVIGAVGHLAEAAWHHPDIHASYASVEVRLQNHDGQGLRTRENDRDGGPLAARKRGRCLNRNAQRPGARLPPLRGLI